MSRCGYSDELDPLDLGRWRAQVKSAIRGKRGQAFLRDLIAALDAMPEKALVSGELQDESGCVCALGALGTKRGVDLTNLDTYDYDQLGDTFDIAHQLAQEVMWINDQWEYRASPERRWQVVRNWAATNLQSSQGAINAN